ncbi:DEAD/DEAH box helicase [Litorimonas sp. WD9-15]|uniref:DEAD/DEAH box helicase n=1 Tax=Litorimonas sp. WD9-15 TaxID=3418716 RepID=UPI003CFC9D26
MIDVLQTTADLRERLAEAVIAQNGIADPNLLFELRKLLKSNSQALLRDPILEGAYPFVQAECTLENLSGTLLHKETVRALGIDENEGFPASRRPYAHQLESWNKLDLTKPAESIVVSSGTGSGKTECFMVPMLDDLIRQDANGGLDDGIRAIMLYPLNALIDSQRERLDAWSRPLGGRIRYALYNSHLSKSIREDVRRQHHRGNPQQVPDRKELYSRPPHILVTNVTMLEYMLVRPQDKNLLEKSQGKLRWIILDEAHTYVGATAAEIALLLRRVMSAFEVAPSEVRIVATSATVGDGQKAKNDLKRFLSNVGGIPMERVHVIEGSRRLPPGPDADNQPDKYRELVQKPGVWSFVQKLYSGEVSVQELNTLASELGLTSSDLLLQLGQTRSGEENLAAFRAHLFQRSLSGLWTCINPECSSKNADSIWPFGKLYLDHRNTCECGSPTLDVMTCRRCGQNALAGREEGGQLLPKNIRDFGDEYVFDALREREEETDDDEEIDSDASNVEKERLDLLFSASKAPPKNNLGTMSVKHDGTILDYTDPNTLSLSQVPDIDGNCPHCSSAETGKKPKLYDFFFSAPSSMTNLTPVMLEAMPAHKTTTNTIVPSAEPDLPMDGRQILSFTDSRQGTARMAANLQRDAERSFVASFIYREVQRRPKALSEEDRALLEKKINVGLELFSESEIENFRSKLENKPSPLSWDTLELKLSERIEVHKWIKDTWSVRDEIYMSSTDGARNIAKALLMREFFARPKFASSIETMGLARLKVSKIENAIPPNVPGYNISPEDWRSFLYAFFTLFIRNRNMIFIGRSMQQWVARKSSRAWFLPPGEFSDRKATRVWPNAKPGKVNSQMAKLLALGLKLDLETSAHRNVINEYLQAAFKTFQSISKKDDKGGYQLHLEDTVSIEAFVNGYFCPVSRRPIDIAPFGISPYARSLEDKASAISFPQRPEFSAPCDATNWLASDAKINELKALGVWRDRHDRVAKFSNYYRTAEHSAQNSRQLLVEYENEFKAGHINVLNCSTTMEMGVDIGSVNGVVMSNLPPSIANYRQRIGRAGRRGQSAALGYTIAKSKPLDMEAFRTPSSYLKRTPKAPKVDLKSEPIVDRHVNAYLLGQFMRKHDGNLTKIDAGFFFGCPSSLKERRTLLAQRPSSKFMEWCKGVQDQTGIREDLVRLCKGTAREGSINLVDRTIDSFKKIELEYANVWDNLRRQIQRDNIKDAGKTGIERQLKRHVGEYLMGYLADKGFLPGHGFPSHVVPFIMKRKQKDASSNQSRFGDWPSRTLDVAIREYAPGSSFMVDGLVYNSGGVTLNWKIPASVEGVSDIQSLRWSASCGDCGHAWTNEIKPEVCPECNNVEVEPQRYLVPSGFCQDHSIKPHADVEDVRFVPMEPVRISVGKLAGHQPLPNPALGRMSADRTGTVFFHSRGEGGEGYALCLDCGRMESQSEDSTEALKDHKSLRWTTDASSICAGNSKDYAIVPKIDLGHQIQTDVFELQPNEVINHPAVAHALAIAIRELLAFRLSIDPQEIGFGLKTARNSLGRKTFVIGLFDKAAGGAGYVSDAVNEFGSLIDRAIEVLDCEMDCERGCSSCVLTGDAPAGGVTSLDRRAALTFARQHLRCSDDLVSEDAKLLQDARRVGDLRGDILAKMRRSSDKSIPAYFYFDLIDPTMLENWILNEELPEWTRQKKQEVTLVIPRKFYENWTSPQIMYARDYLNRTGVKLALGDAPSSAVFASLGNDAWASRDKSIKLPGAHWGITEESIVVSGKNNNQSGNYESIPTSSLKPLSGAQRIDLDSGLDVAISEFGKAFASRVKQAAMQLGADIDSIQDVHYTDAFMCSPLTWRLLLDTVEQLAPKANLQVQTRIPHNQFGNPKAVFHNFRDAATMQSFVKTYSAHKGLNTNISLKDVPHYRRMHLTLSGGKHIHLDLDQGFGWLKYDAYHRLSGNAFEDVKKLNGRLKRAKSFDSYAYVSIV